MNSYIIEHKGVFQKDSQLIELVRRGASLFLKLNCFFWREIILCNCSYSVIFLSCGLGIPEAHRREVWWQVSGAQEKQQKESSDYYEKLISSQAPTDCPFIAQIEKVYIF